MFIYLGKNADPETAVQEMRKEIRTVMSEIQAGSIAKVKSVKYISPDLSSTSAAESSETGKIQNNQVGNSTAIPVLSAVGAVFLIVTLAAAYRFRKDKTRAIDPSTIGPSTLAPSTPVAGSSVTKDTDGRYSPDLAGHDFTHTLPGAYRQTFAMGAILEQDISDCASHSRNSDIIVSECGFTDDDSSRDQESFLGSSMLKDDLILGAREMDDGFGQDDADHMLYDTSEPPLALTADSNKEVRFQLRA